MGQMGARGAGCGRSWQQASAYAHRMSVAVERSHNDAHARHSTCGEGRIKCTGTAVQLYSILLVLPVHVLLVVELLDLLLLVVVVDRYM